MEENTTLDITEELAGKRVDALLATHYPAHSRSYFQYLIEEGAVLINGDRIKKRFKPKEGDEIEVCFLLTPELDLTPEPIPLDILYEDNHLLAINKPAGMVVHPAPGHPSGTFVNALLHHCTTLPQQEGDLRPGIAHRLDKETTGILLAAKTIRAHQELVSLFASRKIKKIYHAVCVGLPEDRLIDAPLARHPIKRKEMAVDPHRGKQALTRIRTLKACGNLALLEVELLTGRTHQIRVHLKHIGSPILGDPTYGAASMNKKMNLERQLLHASLISLLHPITKEPLTLHAPLPADMEKIIRQNELA